MFGSIRVVAVAALVLAAFATTNPARSATADIANRAVNVATGGMVHKGAASAPTNSAQGAMSGVQPIVYRPRRPAWDGSAQRQNVQHYRRYSRGRHYRRYSGNRHYRRYSRGRHYRRYSRGTHYRRYSRGSHYRRYSWRRY